MRKIIYLLILENNNLTARYQNILNVKNFIDNGASVEIVNIAKLVFGKTVSQAALGGRNHEYR
ncbi:MAG: hypothetical protein ACOCM3_05250 [Campylobacter hyointestinalis]